MNPRILLITIGCALGLCGLAALWFVAFRGPKDAYADEAAWMETRRNELSEIAKRLMDYAAKNGNKFPKDAKALAAAGIMTAEQARFVDPVAKVQVLRQFRPAPAITGDKRVIVILETYEPNPNNVLMVAYSDGETSPAAFLENTVAADNLNRARSGLPPIAWVPP